MQCSELNKALSRIEALRQFALATNGVMVALGEAARLLILDGADETLVRTWLAGKVAAIHVAHGQPIPLWTAKYLVEGNGDVS